MTSLIDLQNDMSILRQNEKEHIDDLIHYSLYYLYISLSIPWSDNDLLLKMCFFSYDVHLQ